ncbi:MULTISPECIES: hypothetical protein [unclassified Paenibacillus]|uniref:hypothetical protein n=1 Tax=unclassified Paenibacillus TaxID=185978 RepID=UPI001AE18CF6|nr:MULTISPECIES: hypothetical protein [unclassified Paenibacillus]MBP1155669.1 hypothetical protein [Paenibacillus sp. PvP091]MBP1168945.1 hypothetical protein [Paenibacillus sp. PvR098]MBP2439973.1 hypothetical protein [Paenibacillus sp. PvP052]
MNTNPFDLFEAAINEDEQRQFQELILKGGFTAFRLFIDGFRERLKHYEEHEHVNISRLIASAKELFPEPQAFSPAWAHIWEEYEFIVTYKQTVLETIPSDQREGEWQIILDNPYTTSDLVCYPNLSFMEGAYMYAYFRSDLKNNEYIRLQKIQNLIMAFGSERTESMEKSKDR